ncbi:MAG: aminotransferase class IV [Planctomycetota bacterium]
MEPFKVYLNGAILDEVAAGLPVNDVGFLHGASAFTTMAAFHGRPFRLDRHLGRLLDTVGLLGLTTDQTADSLAAAVTAVLAANELRDRARIRVTLSGGDLRTGEPTALVTAAPLPEYPPEFYTRGVRAVVAPFKQLLGDPTFGYKTGCYFPRILARREAACKGAFEALWFTPANRLAEGCFTNVFLVTDGRLRTPPRDTPVLPGVTREAVLELAAELDIPADDEGELIIDDLLGAGEVFVTASTMGVVPVVQVEADTVGDGTVGPTTQRLMDALNQLIDRETRSA